MMQRHQVGHGAREVNILCGHRKLGQADADQINLAFALTGVKEYEKALAVMDRCCKKWENSGVLACPFCNKQCRTYYLDSLEMIAVALISLDRLTEAFAVLTLCADLSKESERGRPAASVWLGLGQCCADLGLVEEAIQYHMRYVAIEDGPPAVGVIEELESLLDQRPSFYYGGAGHFLAQYWKKRGDDERSEKWKDRLYSLPDCTLGDVSNVFCDGEVLFKEGKFKLALRPFSLALRLHRTLGGFFCKGYAETLFWIGRCWVQLSKFAVAVEVLSWCRDIEKYMGLSTMSTSFYLGDALVGDEKSESSLRYYLEYVVLAEKTESQAHLVKKAIMAMASILTKLGGNDGYVDESYLKFVVERLEDKERARMLKLARTWPGSRVSPPSVVSKRKGHHVSGTASGSSTSILTGEALEMANKEALRHEQELYNWDDTSRAKNQKGRFNRGNVTNQQKATQSGKKKKIKKKKGKPKEKGDRMVGQDLDTRSETKTDVAVTETNNGHLAGLEDARVVDEAVKIVEVDLESDGESNDAVADGYEDQIANNEEHDVKGKDDESEEDGKEDDVESGNENAHISWDDVPRYDHSLAWKVIGREGRYIEENKVKERVVPKWNLGFDHAVAVVERRGGNETIGVEDEVTNGAERVGDLVIYNGSLLGRGASATVTKGKHLEREVAVKCFFVRDEKTRKLVEAETNALKIGDAHQNVVRFFGCVRKDVRVFLILELCEVDLERFVTNDGGTWNHHTLFGNWIVVVKQICKGVSFLHEENVLHRDLKPGNILVHKSNLVKICDFGLAKHVASEMSTVKEIGTKGWRAPEVVLSDQRTKAADVFSTGLICYYVFAGGVHPFGPSPEMREDNIRKRKVSFPPLPDLLQQHFVKMLLEFEVVDRAFMGSRLLQHPLFRSLLGRLTFLTTLFHNSNKSLLRSQSSPAWNEAVDRSLWNRIKSAYRDDLECQLYFVRTLEQHFSDGTDVARVFEKLLNKERGKVTQEDVMQYVQRVFPTLLGRCFSLAWTHNLLK